MKKTLNFNHFVDAFRDAGRENSFTYNGKKALYDYLTQLEEECDMEIELDVVAFDCEYVEYEDLEEVQGDYPDVDSLQDLYNNTQVIEFNHGNLIIASY